MNYILKSATSFLVFVIVLTSAINGQPKKFGDVSKEEFNQEVFEEGSLYPAIKIFKFGEYEIQKEFKYKVVIHERIKILTDEGTELANYVIHHNDERFDQELKKVEAFSFNLKENGKIERTKLDDDNIFEEKGERGWVITKFAIPKVSRGSIIDIRYELELGNAGQLPNWYFDELIPVQWSELQAEIPLFHRFELVSNLRRKLDINRTEDSFSTINYKYRPDTGTYSSAQTRNVRLKSPSQKFTWVMKNTQPVKDLPFLSSVNNYRSFIFLQFKGIEIPNYGIREEYANNWGQIINDLITDKYYGKQIDSEVWSKNVTNRYISESDTEKRRFYKIIDYLSSFSVIQDNEFYIRKNLKDVDDEKRGTPTELNLLLIKLLRSQGFSADPILISTRKNGKVLRNFVLPDQFNKTISLVFLEGDGFLVDASAKSISALQPIENLNEFGLRINKTQGEWISLKDRNISRTDITLDTKVNSDGSTENRLKVEFSGYDVFDREAGTELKAHSSFFKSFVGELGYENYEIVKQDTSKNFFFDPDLSFELTFDSNTSTSNSEKNDSVQTIYLKLPGFKYLNFPKIASEKRILPIEFPFKSIRSITFEIEFPEGYTLDEYSKNKALIISGEPINYTENYSEFKNTLTVKKSLVLAKNKLSSDHFTKFKQIITSVNDEDSFIVLKESNKEIDHKP